MVIEVRYVLGQHSLEVASVDDQYPVQQLAAYRADPSFGDCVRLRCSHGRAQDANAFAGEHGIEDAGELGIPIPDQEPDARHAVAEVHRQVPRLLSDPVGLEYRIVGLTSEFLVPGWSCRDLILAGEPVEDRSAVNPVVDEVDHVWGLGLGLGRCELRERSVWPRLVEMVQVPGENLP